MRLVEVALVAGLVMSYAVYLEHTRASDIQETKDVLILKQMGMDALRSCDSGGSIRGNLLYYSDWPVIDTCLNNTLSETTEYSIYVYNASEVYENMTSRAPGSDAQVVAVEYIIAEDDVIVDVSTGVYYDFTVLRLLLWFKQ